MRVFYTDGFPIPLPSGHAFPIEKYRLLRERLQADPDLAVARFEVAPAVTRGDLLLAHDRDYVDAVCAGTLTAHQVRKIGFPWSPEMVERSLRSCGATLAAARAAVVDRTAVYLGGGTHHASSDEGQGFCVFNDCAVAARALQRDAGVGRVLIVDCDVHQGNGTAAIFADDSSVFTFSIHGARNFPLHKAVSDLDVALPDQTGDGDYLAALEAALARAFADSDPDFVFYLAGADPLDSDKLGRLALSKAGLAERDRRVLAAVGDRPLTVVMAGGYGAAVGDTVDVHAETVRQVGVRARRGCDKPGT